MFEPFVLFSVSSIVIFFIAIILKRKLFVSAIVATEFILSNGLIEFLFDIEIISSLLFAINYTISGLLSAIVALLISLSFIKNPVSKSAVIVAVLYFLHGCYSFVIMIESTPLNYSYPFDVVGLYNNIEDINNTFCVLILIATGFSVVGGNGKRLYDFFNFRGNYAGSNKYMLFSVKSRNNNSFDEA